MWVLCGGDSTRLLLNARCGKKMILQGTLSRAWVLWQPHNVHVRPVHRLVTTNKILNNISMIITPHETTRDISSFSKGEL